MNKPIMRKHFLILTFLIQCIAVQASPNQELDSLLLVLDSAAQDTSRAKLLLQIGKILQQQDAELSKSYLEQGIILSEQLNYTYGIARSYYLLGESYRNLGEYPQAISNLTQAVDAARSFADSTEILIKTYNALGLTFWNMGDHHQALSYYFNSRKMAEKTNDMLSLARIYNNIGIIYKQQNTFDKALEYYKKSYEMAVELDNKFGQGLLLNNIGNLYIQEEAYKEAEENLLKALAIRKKLNNKNALASTFSNLAVASQYLNKINQARVYHLESLGLYEEIGNPLNIAFVNQRIGSFYLYTKDYQQAIRYFNVAITILGDKEDLETKSLVFEGLSNVYKALRDYKKAFDYHVKFKELNDRMLENRKTEILEQLEMQAVFEKQQREFAIEQEKQQLAHEIELNKQELLRNTSLIGFASMLLITLLIFRNFKRKQLANQLLAEKNEEIRTTLDLVDEERQKSEDLLLNILPQRTAKELKETGKAKPQAYEQASVLFTDFVGFTNISETLSPAELVEELDDIFQNFDVIIKKHGLEKIKTIGDAYMAAGGLPEPDTNHVYQIVEAGLEILNYINQRNQNPNRPNWQLRIGINTGAIVAGVVGKHKFAYDIWGDAVNLAARMEQSGTPGKLNISEHTYKLIKADFDCEYRGKIEAKNKGAINMYFVKKKLTQIE